MEHNEIIIKGARENNLKNIDLTIPKNKLVVFTGVSGSGKSTLAFDTIFAEGQRRYVESLSSYARQFLGNFEKPDVDSIDGLSPAISIDQKTTSHNPRSTVGTVTEIYDYLRLLFARVGHPYCPTHNIEITKTTIDQIVRLVKEQPLETKVIIMAPIVRNEKGTFKDIIDDYIKKGFSRMEIDGGEIQRFEEPPALEKNRKHNIDIVIDRMILKEDSDSRLFDSISTCFDLAKGYVVIKYDGEEHLYSEHQSCSICGFSIPPLEPRLFSFNNPLGCCPDCNGLGLKTEVNPSLLVPNDNFSIKQGAILYYKNQIDSGTMEWEDLIMLCEHFSIPLDVPFKKLTDEQKNIIFYGPPYPIEYKYRSAKGSILNRIIDEGVATRITRLYQQTTSSYMREYYQSFMSERVCPTCHGARLSKEVLSVKINGLNIYEVCLMSFDKLLDFMNNLKLSASEENISSMVVLEIKNRLKFLINVGLDYLNLARLARTLSGGESQRIRLATQIGSKLSGVLYVLDEPSIGLHQRDNDKLIETLKEMRDLGNSLIVVEHDEDTMLASDYLVDIGPGAGDEGGNIVASGTPTEVINNPNSLTGKYLKGELKIEVPSYRAKGNGKKLVIKKASCHNLKNIDVTIPLGTFTVVTGVSGSGKSSLVNEVLYKSLLKYFGIGKEEPGEVSDILGMENIDKVINVSQEPIGKTPRSNPATYIGVFDDIRDLFSMTIDARAKGYTKSQFSFNVKGGRCEACEGDGVKKISMNFLPDVYVTCEVCGGKRYNADVLSVKYKEKNIFDILDMRVEEAVKFFEFNPSIKRKLQTLEDVGLSYIKLGQSSTTLSGGEAQRIKLAYELQKKAVGHTLYILDEPTTGLHMDDVKKLLSVLKTFVENGNTVLVIEHNLDVIKSADYIIDLGPEGGDKGGNLVCEGTPEDIVKVKQSYTGYYLNKVLAK